MSIIYGVIARGTDIILVDHEAIPSNFPKLVQLLLSKIKPNDRSTYIYSEKYDLD